MIFMERTFLAVKPDGVKRGMVGEILSRFEKLGLKIVGMKMVWVDEDLLRKHYDKDEAWFEKVGTRSLEFWKENGLLTKRLSGLLTKQKGARRPVLFLITIRQS